MVLSWLNNAVIKDIGQSFPFFPIAQAVWVHLEQRFGEADGIRIFKVQRDLCLVYRIICQLLIILPK